MIDAPALRVVLLRCFGLAVGVALAVVAVGLLAYGIERPLAWLTNGLASLATWVSSDLSPGAAMLIGFGLVVLAILSALVMLPRRSAGLHRVQQSKDGTTWVDISSVARTLERSLRNDVDSKIGVRAQKDHLSIVAPARSEAPFSVADAASDIAQRELATMGLSGVAYVVTIGSESRSRPSESRRQPRVQ